MSKIQYTESELRVWWDRLTQDERAEILDTIEEKATISQVQHFAISTRRSWQRGETLSHAQLAGLRKWVR